MPGKNTLFVAVIGSLDLGASLAAFADDAVNAGQVVKALEDTFGFHPAERRNHIKGSCAWVNAWATREFHATVVRLCSPTNRSARHPDIREHAHFVETHNPPASDANSAYCGIHTFRFISQENKTTLVRCQFVPQDGEKRLSDEELKSAGPNFLERALIRRTQQGSILWAMVAAIGEPGDSETCPAIAWP